MVSEVNRVDEDVVRRVDGGQDFVIHPHEASAEILNNCVSLLHT